MHNQTQSSYYREYSYRDASAPHTSAYLLRQLDLLCGDVAPGTRVLDVGCGNGFLAGHFLARQCQVLGIDLSSEGIAIARSTSSRNDSIDFANISSSAAARLIK